jgi:LEA14-like dessication related protein
MSDTEIELKPRSVTTIPVPVAIPFSDLLKTLDSVKSRQDVAYDLAVALMVKTGLGTYRVPVQKEGRLPVLTLPQVRLQGVKLDALTLKGASLEVAVEIATPPQAALALTNLTYALTVNEAKLAAGTAEPEPVKANGAQLVRIPVHLDVASLRAILGSGSSGQERVTVKLTGEANFSSPYGRLTLPFAQTGKLAPSK